MKKIVSKFIEKIGNKRKLITCGSCGERTHNLLYKEVSVESELMILKLNEKQIDGFESLDEFENIASITRINNVSYNIHPECVTIFIHNV